MVADAAVDKEKRRRTGASVGYYPCPTLFNTEEERDKERWRKREEKFKLLHLPLKT
jgi:hypothetical protein